VRLPPIAVLALLAIASIGPAEGQAPSHSTPDGAALARGWQAYAEGRFPDAIMAADDVLRRAPADHHAAGLKIEALAGSGNPAAALTAYDEWLPIARREDPHLLSPIGLAVLRDLAASQDENLRVEALLVLARRGDDAARARLFAAAGEQLAGQVEELALARLGEPEAVERLAARLAEGRAPDPAQLIAVLEEARRPEAATAIVPFLEDQRSFVRGAAARAIGILGHRAAVARLTAALEDPHPYVRMSAAVALVHLGEPAAYQPLGEMLFSEVPDIRLSAAEIYAGEPGGPWVAAVAPLLEHEEPLVRLKAARVLAESDPDGAATAIRSVLADPNPILRLEASRLAGGVLSADLASLRRLLRDADPWVRLHAASALVPEAG
jgi:HEAT repeat protein